MITLEQFRATKQRVESIEVEIGAECYDEDGEVVDKPGYVYAGWGFIEIEPDGRLTLTIMGDSQIGSEEEKLAEFEARLYQSALDFGVLEDW